MLTDTAVRNARPKDKPYKLADTGGLYLQVNPNGTKYWRLKFRLAGKEKKLALGVYPTVKLAEARAERDKWKPMVKAGLDPVIERQLAKVKTQQAAANTFQAIAERWIVEHRKGWSAYYCKQVERYLEKDVYPHIGRLPVHSITREHVKDVVQRIEKRVPKGAAAVNVRQWVQAVLLFAVDEGLIADVPNLRIKIKRKPVEHAKNHDRQALADFVKRLEGFGGNRTTAIALDLMLLLFVRTVEVRRAEWAEFDIDGPEPMWRIPADKMKRRREHWVPLPTQAVALLQELRKITGAARYLFPNMRRPSEPMSPTTINRALEYLGYGSGEFSGHDFRATASTLLREVLGFPGEWVEVQLAHGPRSAVEAAYNHSRYIEGRRRMLQVWAGWLADPGASTTNVVDLQKAVA